MDSLLYFTPHFQADRNSCLEKISRIQPIHSHCFHLDLSPGLQLQPPNLSFVYPCPYCLFSALQPEWAFSQRRPQRTPLLKVLQCLSVSLKVLRVAYKTLNDLAPWFYHFPYFYQACLTLEPFCFSFPRQVDSSPRNPHRSFLYLHEVFVQCWSSSQWGLPWWHIQNFNLPWPSCYPVPL